MSLSRMMRNVPFPRHFIARDRALSHVKADDVLERDERMAPSRSGRAQEAVKRHRKPQQRRHLARVARLRQSAGDRKAQIGDERKRVRRIDRKRGQHRENRLQEMVFQPGQVGSPSTSLRTM
jgi:hypothetical protein